MSFEIIVAAHSLKECQFKALFVACHQFSESMIKQLTALLVNHGNEGNAKLFQTCSHHEAIMLPAATWITQNHQAQMMIIKWVSNLCFENCPIVLVKAQVGCKILAQAA